MHTCQCLASSVRVLTLATQYSMVRSTEFRAIVIAAHVEQTVHSHQCMFPSAKVIGHLVPIFMGHSQHAGKLCATEAGAFVALGLLPSEMGRSTMDLTALLLYADWVATGPVA